MRLPATPLSVLIEHHTCILKPLSDYSSEFEDLVIGHFLGTAACKLERLNKDEFRMKQAFQHKELTAQRSWSKANFPQGKKHL